MHMKEFCMISTVSRKHFFRGLFSKLIKLCPRAIGSQIHVLQNECPINSCCTHTCRPYTAFVIEQYCSTIAYDASIISEERFVARHSQYSDQ